MKDIKFIEKQIELLLDFKPNTEYSKSYLSPKDRINKLMDKCASDVELFFRILDAFESDLSFELSEYEYGEHYGVGPSYFEHYNAFSKEMMNEINRKNQILNKPLYIENSSAVEEISDIEKLQYRTKIILLNELGVLEFLREKEHFQSNTELSKLITKIIVGKNEDEKSVYNTIRTDLSYVNQPNHNKSPYSESQIKLVNSILSTFYLPNIK